MMSQCPRHVNFICCCAVLQCELTDRNWNQIIHFIPQLYLSDFKQYCRAQSLMTPAARSADNQDDILHVGAHDGRHKSGMKITCFCFKLYIFKLNCNALLQYYCRLQRLLTLRLWSQCVHNSRKLNCCPIHLRWMERTLPPTRLFRYLLCPAIYIQMPWLIAGRGGCWAGRTQVS